MRRLEFRIYCQHGETGRITHRHTRLGQPIPELGKGWDVIDKCQFTGKLGESGKEIFGGDIIRVTDPSAEYFPSDPDGELFIVKWSALCCGWSMWHIEADTWWAGDINPWSYEPVIEIIGNIYDNPELLNTEKS